MIIKNVQVFTEEGKFEPGEIIIENGVFQDVASNQDEVIDGQGGYAIPGLVDVHFHGAVGHDFCDGTEEAIREIAKYEASQGITTIVPATMTLSEEELLHISRRRERIRAKRALFLRELIWKDRLFHRGKRVLRQEHIL